jgi:hypothetical protein
MNQTPDYPNPLHRLRLSPWEVSPNPKPQKRDNPLSQFDWDPANRELTGEPNAEPKDAGRESAPESARSAPVSGSSGHKVSAAASDDEDDEGRSDGERLVEEVIAGAEHDPMCRATKKTNADADL